MQIRDSVFFFYKNNIESPNIANTNKRKQVKHKENTENLFSFFFVLNIE